MKKKLVIIGAGGHGKVVADIARKNGYESICFLDDDASVKQCGGYPVAGPSADAANYNCDIAVAIGNAAVRQKIQQELEAKQMCVPALIHPQAVIGEHVVIGAGTVIMAGSVINPGSRIGKGCIVNTCASVDHDCRISDYAHISVGAHLAGAVAVGERTWIGIGAVVSNNIEVSEDSIIGAGAVVVKSIDQPGTYAGVPARKIK